VIDPPPKGEPYPGRLPPVRDQWGALSLGLRSALVAVPVLVVAVLLLVNLDVGATVAVLLAGAAAATVTFAKNRTDRHNASVDRGEIAVAEDLHLSATAASDLDARVLAVLEQLGHDSDDIGRVTRFDGGWIVRRRNPRDVASVVGDDGGCALFDPRTVTEMWAASEYLAGRGRELGAGAQ
jgi:hypothetical protein